MSVIKNLIAWEELLFFFCFAFLFLYGFRIPKPNLIEKLRKKERKTTVSVRYFNQASHCLCLVWFCCSLFARFLCVCFLLKASSSQTALLLLLLLLPPLWLCFMVDFARTPHHHHLHPSSFPPTPQFPPHILNLLPFINSTPDHFPFVDIDFLSYAETSSLHSTHWSGTMQFNSQFRSTKNADFGWKLKPFLLLKKCWPISQSFMITILIFERYYFQVCKLNS